MSAVGAAAGDPIGHRFHPTVLREYDIRGIVGETLFAADARALGQAYATLLRAEGGRRACLGFDGRLSSPELAEALGEGLRAGGVDVLWIGRGPTPMLYFAVHHLGADGGLQVTGSHNPPDHNGFKMMLGKASLFGARIQELGRIAASGALRDRRRPDRIESPVFDAYVERLLHDFRGGRELAVVWDAGNGATGEALSALAARLPGRHSAAVRRDRRPLPEPSPRPDDPGKPRGPDPDRARRGRRARHRLRRRRRPDRRGRRPGPDHVRRPADADPGGRGAGAPAGQPDPRRRQGEPGAVRRDRPPRRQARHVQDRPFADEGRDGRDARPARRRDVGPHLLRRRLLRPRRRALRRDPPAQHPRPERSRRSPNGGTAWRRWSTRRSSASTARTRRSSRSSSGSRRSSRPKVPRSTRSTASAS